ncbi:alpha/beta fold hydrolase [Nostoc sp.]|uniref:alpha/beta fold hydrolase n=1 Tax=Nostoc sp. TaxID=1180 RepID=UPI002FF9CD4B
MSHTPASPSATSSFTPALLPTGFTSATAEVNGVTIHYVMGGTGDPLVLVHGWPQTWYEWHGIILKRKTAFWRNLCNERSQA